MDEPTAGERRTLATYMRVGGSGKIAAHELGVGEGAVASALGRLYSKIDAVSALDAASRVAPTEYRALVDAIERRT